MENRKEVMDIISQFVGQHNIITAPRALVKFMGSINSAIFLSQIIFWSDKGKDPEGWFYKTVKELMEETGLSEYQIRSETQKCIKKNLIKTKVKKVNGNPTLHYFLNVDALSIGLFSFLRKETSVSKETINTEDYIHTSNTPLPPFSVVPTPNPQNAKSPPSQKGGRGPLKNPKTQKLDNVRFINNLTYRKQLDAISNQKPSTKKKKGQ